MVWHLSIEFMLQYCRIQVLLLTDSGASLSYEAMKLLAQNYQCAPHNCTSLYARCEYQRVLLVNTRRSCKYTCFPELWAALVMMIHHTLARCFVSSIPLGKKKKIWQGIVLNPFLLKQACACMPIICASDSTTQASLIICFVTRPIYMAHLHHFPYAPVPNDDSALLQFCQHIRISSLAVFPRYCIL